MKQKAHFYYFDLVMVAFVVLLLLSNIAATKLIEIGPFILDGGAILFPFTYVIGDIITEVYGLKRAQRAIMTALGVSVFTALTFLAVQALPSADSYTNQAAFEAVLGFVPQIVVASLAAFFCGQMINAYVLTAIKQRWGEKRLWIRLVSSTVAGQLIDTAIFCTIAFFGVLQGGEFINYVLVGVAYKVLIELLALPVTYTLIRRLKSGETTAIS